MELHAGILFLGNEWLQDYGVILRVSAAMTTDESRLHVS